MTEQELLNYHIMIPKTKDLKQVKLYCDMGYVLLYKNIRKNHIVNIYNDAHIILNNISKTGCLKATVFFNTEDIQILSKQDQITMLDNIIGQSLNNTNVMHVKPHSTELSFLILDI